MMHAHPSERDFGRLDFPTGKESILAATRCQCFSSSSSSANDSRIAATDQAIVGTGGSRVASGGGRVISLGSGSTQSKASKSVPRSQREPAGQLSDVGGGGNVAYAETGAVTAGGNLNTGLDLSGVSVGGDLTLGDTAAVESAYNSALEALGLAGQQNSAAITDANSLTKDVLEKVLGAVTGEPAGKSALTPTTIIWAGGLAVAAIYFWRKGKA